MYQDDKYICKMQSDKYMNTEVVNAAFFALPAAFVPDLARHIHRCRTTRWLRIIAVNEQGVPMRGVTVGIDHMKPIVVDETGSHKLQVPKHGDLLFSARDGDVPMLIENATAGHWKFTRQVAEGESTVRLVLRRINSLGAGATA